MRKEFSRALEEVANRPLEWFSKPVLIGGWSLVVVSWGLLLYFLQIPIHIKIDTGHHTRSLASLLWKVRVNR